MEQTRYAQQPIPAQEHKPAQMASGARVQQLLIAVTLIVTARLILASQQPALYAAAPVVSKGVALQLTVALEHRHVSAAHGAHVRPHKTFVTLTVMVQEIFANPQLATLASA